MSTSRLPAARWLRHRRPRPRRKANATPPPPELQNTKSCRRRWKANTCLSARQNLLPRRRCPTGTAMAVPEQQSSLGRLATLNGRRKVNGLSSRQRERRPRQTRRRPRRPRRLQTSLRERNGACFAKPSSGSVAVGVQTAATSIPDSCLIQSGWVTMLASSVRGSVRNGVNCRRQPRLPPPRWPMRNRTLPNPVQTAGHAGVVNARLRQTPKLVLQRRRMQGRKRQRQRFCG